MIGVAPMVAMTSSGALSRSRSGVTAVPRWISTPNALARRTSQARNPFNNRRGVIPLKANMRTHTIHFMNMHETILEYRFLDRASALSHTIQRNHLRLKIRRESRIRCRYQADCLGTLSLHIKINDITSHRNII